MKTAFDWLNIALIWAHQRDTHSNIRVFLLVLYLSCACALTCEFSHLLHPEVERDFLQFTGRQCPGRVLEYGPYDEPGGHAACKALCVSRPDCGAVEVHTINEVCLVKDLGCVTEDTSEHWNKVLFIRVNFDTGAWSVGHLQNICRLHVCY